MWYSLIQMTLLKIPSSEKIIAHFNTKKIWDTDIHDVISRHFSLPQILSRDSLRSRVYTLFSPREFDNENIVTNIEEVCIPFEEMQAS
jgi:hypothetical protein